MTNNNRFQILTLVLGGIFTLMLNLASCSNDNKEDLFPPLGIVFEDVSYATDILPIINTNCAVPGCHAAPNGVAGVVLGNYTQLKAIVDEEQLINVINNTNNFSLMPPSSFSVLSDSSIVLIQQWVLEGAQNN